VIEGERRRLPIKSDARFQPLLVTTLGRSGSTWLTWLLGKHPELMDYRSFEYEPRVAGYFTEMLRALTQPAGYYQALRGDIDTGSWWLGRNPDQGLPWYASEPSVDDWLGAGYVEELIAFFAGRIDALQSRIATATGKTRATYFIEKFPPVFFAQRMLWEVYPRTKEVFLVRDFRDVLCSILDFEGKRGSPWYPIARPANAVEVVRGPLGDEVMHLLMSWRERSADAHLLRYEDLVLDPAGALSALLDYLGVDGAPKTIDGMIAAASDLDPRLRDEHTTSGSPRESVGRWRTELDPPLVAICDEMLGDALAAFGYSTS
jgi:Sulfotransferase family